MRVFVAGASGAIGTRLVPQLINARHQVIGTFNSPGNAERVRALGAEPIALDLLDPRAVRKAVLETEPDAIVHQATAGVTGHKSESPNEKEHMMQWLAGPPVLEQLTVVGSYRPFGAES